MNVIRFFTTLGYWGQFVKPLRDIPTLLFQLQSAETTVEMLALLTMHGLPLTTQLTLLHHLLQLGFFTTEKTLLVLSKVKGLFTHSQQSEVVVIEVEAPEKLATIPEVSEESETVELVEQLEPSLDNDDDFYIVTTTTVPQ